ncbi:MAG: helix-turn-helix domain-containing protein [Fibrobacter sp.]|nr:helix-turn-helix domain-containing protein [Fibrobacter sp.]
MEKEFLTSKELADYMNISIKFVEKYRHTGRIPGAVKVGGSWRFSKDEIDRHLLNGKLLQPVLKINRKAVKIR